MSEASECFVSFYKTARGGVVKGWQQLKASDCEQEEDWMRRSSQAMPIYRIHVRLKPEGAPKRYADEYNRQAWEADPGMCRMAAAMGNIVYLNKPYGFYAASPRTPKIEESA